MHQAVDKNLLWDTLRTILDPEIPVLSLVEMNIIRDVQPNGDTVVVTISPTFVGCPALEHMKDEIRTKLIALGCRHVEIETTFSPPWSTDMLDDTAREKLRAFGVAPPAIRSESIAASFTVIVQCPFCSSPHTRMENAFGPTLCRQIYYCDNCRQSFERFKTI